MRFIITLALAALLAACGSSTELQFNDKQDPTRITGVKGLDSHDAANVLTNRDYIDGKVKPPQKAIVSIKAHPGQTIEIKAAEFTVWQPSGPQDDIRPAPQARSTFERNTAAVGGLIKDATPLAGAALLVSDRKDARQVGLQQSQIDAETTRQQNNLQHDTTTRMMEILDSKIPDPEPTP